MFPIGRQTSAGARAVDGPAGLGYATLGGMTTYATAPSGALPGLSARQTDSYVIAVMNQKGGVGKTMVTLALAAHTGCQRPRSCR